MALKEPLRAAAVPDQEWQGQGSPCRAIWAPRTDYFKDTPSQVKSQPRFHPGLIDFSTSTRFTTTTTTTALVPRAMLDTLC